VKIPMTDRSLDFLIKKMDRDGDGEIDFGCVYIYKVCFNTNSIFLHCDVNNLLGIQFLPSINCY
jgi:hypothetical protein